MSKKILIAGESWTMHTIHIKGFDTFTTSAYGEGIEFIRNAFTRGGAEVEFLPNHYAAEEFPTTLEELGKYDLVILSDIGANTLLLPNDVFAKGLRIPDRLELIKDYVANGGAFVMVGGYMSFTGIDGKARYGQTAIQDILPVKMLEIDDRVEKPQGVVPEVIKEHPVLEGIPKEWPFFLGYNKTIAEEGAEILATINGDPFIAVKEFGKGKTAVFTSDCAPHWGPEGFVKWEYYDKFWQNLLNWLTV
ncbi:glutamine amidotransferase [Clostridium formicaceticum]|uniref:Cytoplasmic protein n=1 Tax=Clostridium formicaceticum TaxID=1497 RepID=A0AAC9RJW3_9CLOT|nr:glutamine amidotransferase [Clostridium formicaceticum]AOY76561.1 cytoplasmic protein [Clostridium formicaceticum]ARE86979.1 hypothetical protein CLFO_13640 [Clostridium formicaceticum]